MALDKKSSVLVAVKKVRMVVPNSIAESESKMLKECASNFIVRYFDLVKVGNEVWVRVIAVR